ncbi:MAG: hypothetical protein WBM40_08600 [Thiohalocapsa sp.]
MPDRLRKLLGILLMLAAIGVASMQTLLVSCSSPAAAGSPRHVDIVSHQCSWQGASGNSKRLSHRNGASV